MTAGPGRQFEDGVRAADDGVVYVTHLEDEEGWTPIPELNSRWMRFLLGSRSDITAPVAWIVEIPPGFTVARHRHAVSRLEIVLSGFYIEEGGTKRTSGSLSFFPANEYYGPLHFPEGGRMVEFFDSGENIEPIFDEMPDEATARALTSLGMTPTTAS